MILHVITGLSTGGAENALYNVLAGGLAQQNEVAVLSLRDEGTMGAPIEALGVPVLALYLRGGVPAPGTLGRLRRLVREIQPEVIQGWMYHGNLAASVAARMLPDRPAVAWNVRHSLYGLNAERPLTRLVIRANRLWSGKADAIIYNSRISRRQHESFGFQSARATVIPNGFDLGRLRPDPGTAVAVRQELGLPADGFVIGHIARFHPVKDHASFLRAAVKVAREVAAARFLLVGRGVSPNNQALISIIPPELEDRFVFAGERSDVERLIQAMDMLATSSAGEAFPNVLGEAMACGVPCVTTDVGDSADIVGNTGIVVPPSDPRALADGLQAMLGKSDEDRRALGRTARARVHENYSLTAAVAEYSRLYGGLCAKGRR